jgi:hypothetical protein
VEDKSKRAHANGQYTLLLLVQLHSLPPELLARVVIHAAVAHKLQGPLTSFNDSYRHLAAVCRLWREVLKAPSVWRRVKERVNAIGESGLVEGLPNERPEHQ